LPAEFPPLKSRLEKFPKKPQGKLGHVARFGKKTF
jgi:hypothetical protein